MAPALLPDAVTIKRYCDAGLHIWLLWGKRDEVITSPEFVFHRGIDEYQVGDGELFKFI